VLLAATSAAAIDAGDFDVIVGPNTGSRRAGRSIGRFATLLGAEGRHLLEQCAAAVPHGRLPIELVYLPQGLRGANVTVRPAVAASEICIAVAPGVGEDAVVPLDELRVGIRDGRLALQWADTVVHVTSMHMLNSSRAPALCRFLTDVGEDGVAQLVPFSWGSAARFPRLPRVRSGRLVLRVAQWRISPAALTPQSVSDANRFPSAFNKWRTEWSVPRHVYLAEADNRLLLDLNDDMHLTILRQETARAFRNGRHVQLEEVYPRLDQTWVRGPEGDYVVELTIPLHGTETESTPTRRAPSRRDVAGSPTALPRPLAGDNLEAPGSDWLFIRLPVPLDAMDDLIAGPVSRLANALIARGDARLWFFVRYADPEPHLRLRFFGQTEKLIGRVVPAVAEALGALAADGVCSGWSIESYDREIERYGGHEAMALAEEVFGADSRACAKILAAIRAHDTDLDLILLAVLSIDQLLESFGLNFVQRLAWDRNYVVSRRVAGTAFRQSNRILRQLLGTPTGREIAGGLVSEALLARAAEVLPARCRLDELAAGGQLLRPRADILRVLVHMHCNRLLGIDRIAENLALGLLLRTHESLTAAPLAQQR
jgi:thiopeptide-type bacteriocin biosynthesis protein